MQDEHKEFIRFQSPSVSLELIGLVHIYEMEFSIEFCDAMH